MRLNALRAHQTVVFLLLVAISWAAWTYMLSAHHHSTGLAPMHHAVTTDSSHDWPVFDFAGIFAVWAVMMAAMMTPSVIPMALGFIRIRRRSLFRHPYLGSLAFLAGYFLIWLLFCGIATAAQCQLQTLDLLSLRMESQNTALSAGLLILAGLYQVTPWKAACLAHCRTASGLSAACHGNAVGIGLHHGVNCVGSCWALMAMMFAVGVLNLPWMGIVTAIVVMEKVLPVNPVWLRYSSGLAFLIWGGWLLMRI